MSLLDDILKRARQGFGQVTQAVTHSNYNPIADTNPNQAGNQNFWTDTARNLSQQAPRALDTIFKPVLPAINTQIHNWGQNAASAELNAEKNVPLYGQVQAGIRDTVAPILRNVVSQSNVDRYKSFNQPNTSGIAGDVARFAGGQVPYLPLMIATEGIANPVTSRIASLIPKGEGIINSALSTGAKTAVHFAPYGWMGGLDYAKTPKERVQNIGKSTAENVALGGGLGLVGGAARGALENVIRKFNPKDSPEQISQKTTKYIARVFTRGAGGKFAKNDAKPFVPAGPKNYAVPKDQPFKITKGGETIGSSDDNAWMDKVDQHIKDNLPQPGLSIKLVKPDQLHQLQRGGELPSRTMNFSETPGIENDLRSALAGAASGKDEAQIINEFTDNALKTAKGNSLKATKAALNKEINGIVGKTGNYKADFAMRQTLKGDPALTDKLNALEDNIARIDSAINNPTASGKSATGTKQISSLEQPQVPQEIQPGLAPELPIQSGKILSGVPSPEIIPPTKGKSINDLQKVEATNKRTIDNMDEFFNNLPTSAVQKVKNLSRSPGLEKINRNAEGRQKARLLFSWNQKLAEMGYSSEKIKNVGSAGMGRKIIEGNISPKDFTPEVRQKLQGELAAQYAEENANPQIYEQKWQEHMQGLRQKASEEMQAKKEAKFGKPNQQEQASINDFENNVLERDAGNTSVATPIKQILQDKKSSGSVGSTLMDQKIKEFDDFVNRSGFDVKTKVGILDYFRTPDRVLNKMGLGKEAGALRASYDNYLKQLPVEIDKITQWSKRADSKDSARTIFQYLDGKEVNLSLNDLKIATEIKSYLKGWSERLGLPEEKRVSNYITHIFDKEFLQKEFDPELAKLIRDKVPGSVYDPFTEQRLGKQGYIEDAWQALDAYVKRGVRKENLDPILKQIKDVSEGMETSQFNYVKKYIDRINMRPTDLDNLIDNSIKQVFGYKFGQRPVTAITRGLRQMGYRGALGMNVGSALRNLSQGTNTYAKLGEKYTTLGYLKLITQGTKELEDVGVLRNDMVEDRTINATKKFWEKTDKRMFWLFETAEKINRGSAYFGAKAKAIAKGLDEEQAIEYAKKIVRDTQFTFGSVDTPAVLQGDLAKTVLQFQSYNVKQAEFLGEMVKNKEYAGLARWGLANLAFTYTLGQLIGMKPEQAIPFNSVWTGQSKIGATPSIQAIGNLKDAAFGGKDQYGNDLTPKDRVGKVIDAAVPLFPGGVQAKKTLQGLDAVRKGYSESSSGRVQYEAPEDPVTAARAGLFGKNNLPQAQEYFDKKRTPLGDKQTAAFKSLSGDERKGYLESVFKQRESSKLLDEIKKKMEQGMNVDDLIKKASASDKTPAEKNILLKAKEDIAKQRADTLGEVQTVGNKIFYNDNGSVKTIDLSPPTKGEGIDAFSNQNWSVNKALDVYKSKLPQDKKSEAYKQLGIDGKDMEYAYKSSKSVDIKTQYAINQAKTLTHDQLIERMLTGRVESIAGDMFITNGVVDNLNTAGLLSAAEAKQLKKIKLDKDGKSIAKASSGGTGNKKAKAIADFYSKGSMELSKLFQSNIKNSSPSNAARLDKVLQSRSPKNTGLTSISSILAQSEALVKNGKKKDLKAILAPKQA